MSNKLYIALFTLFIGLVTSDSAHSSVNAYDNDDGSQLELIDFEYGRYNFIDGQVIEYFDLATYERRYATITNIEDNFSSIILTISDNKTGEIREITIFTEN